MSRTVIALSLLLSFSTAPAATIVLYDGTAGTLPHAQPWLTYIGFVTPTVVADGAALDSRNAPGGQAGFFNHRLLAPPKTWAVVNPAFPVLDPAAGFTLSFWLAVADENHQSTNRAGFSVIVIGEDRRGIELGFWEQRIWAQSGADFKQAEGVAIDTTARKQYSLSIQGATYTLRVNGTPVLSGPTRDYTTANPTVDPYEQRGMVFLGDDTTSADASIVLGTVSLTQPYVPDDTPPIASLTLASPVVVGCKSVNGTVTLAEAAPAGGAVVMLTDNLAAATTPTAVIVPGGATAQGFTVQTSPVASSASGSITATLGTSTASGNLTVRPIGVKSITATPGTVVGGKPVVGKATLECPAGPGPVEVALSSNNAAVAGAIAPSVFVPQGLTSTTFDVATQTVLARTKVTITAAAAGVAKSKVITVDPAASVSPASLKFGSIAVGHMSAAMNATLSNKGATTFTVGSIGLSGTGAASFARTNNCPASLPPGGSCSIAVTFTPTVAGSKVAKLTIATSATSAPLSVSLAGSGL